MPDAERRQLTVLFCDLVGSTPLAARLDPEEMREVVRAYQKVCSDILSVYDGFLARYLGDGVLAYFGYPRAHEDDAERAVRAGLDMLSAVSGLKTPTGEALAARVGIATGTVVVGDLIGSGESQERAVVGDAPNLADRIKGLAEPGTVVIAPSTRRLLGKVFELRELGHHTLKGYTAPIEAWAVVGEAPSESRFEAVRTSRLTDFVGREDEFAFLLACKDQAWQGKGRMVLLTGEPGIGKSRLLEELAARVRSEPHSTLRYQCSPYHSGSALFPFTTLLTRAAGMKAEDTSEQRLDKLESVIAPAATPSTSAVPIFAALLSIPLGKRYAPPHVSAAQQRRQTFAALLDQFEFQARQQPLLVMFEDLHWADATSLEFLALMAKHIERLPILAILTSRPGLGSGWAGIATIDTLPLGRLDRSESLAMIHSIAGLSIPEGLAATIIERTDGIPLFIEESTRAVLEAGTIDKRQMAGSDESLSVPASLQASLMSRLDRLSPVKDVAQIGATIGREFSLALLRAVSAMDDAALKVALAQLEASDLITATRTGPDVTYLFKHALVQEAAYETLLRSRRVGLHRAIAEAMRDRFPDIAEKEPEVVARHFTQARVSDAAIEWWKRAGEQALRRSAYVEAISHLKAALGLAEALPAGAERQRILLRLQLMHGQALIAQKGYAAPETTAAFVRARELAAGTDDATERISLYYGLWVGSYTRSELAPMLEMADALLQEAEGRPGTSVAVLAHRIFGTTCTFRGDFVTAIHHLERAVSAYDRERDGPLVSSFGQDLGVAAEIFLALTLLPLGQVDRALRIADSAVERARQSGHVPTMAYAHAYMCVFEALRGLPARATPHAEALADISNQHGMGWWWASGLFFRGWTQWHAGRRETALADMQQGMALSRMHGLMSAPPFFQALVAEIEAAEGRTEEALAMFGDLISTIELSGEHWMKAETHRQHGNLLRQRGANDLAKAETAFLTALRAAQHQKARVFELRAALDLAALYRDLDQRSRARFVLEPTLLNWPDGVDLREVGQARNLFSSLQ
jgi:class 3 adenylate cyclase/predicted ATPase